MYLTASTDLRGDLRGDLCGDRADPSDPSDPAADEEHPVPSVAAHYPKQSTHNSIRRSLLRVEAWSAGSAAGTAALPEVKPGRIGSAQRDHQHRMIGQGGAETATPPAGGMGPTPGSTGVSVYTAQLPHDISWVTTAGLLTPGQPATGAHWPKSTSQR